MGYIFWGTALGGQGEGPLKRAKLLFLQKYFFLFLQEAKTKAKGDVILFKRVSNSGNLIGRVIRAFPLFVQGFPENMSRELRTLFGSKWDSNELSLPVKMVDLLGEQLLTEVKPFLNMTLRSASALMLGVLQTELL